MANYVYPVLLACGLFSIILVVGIGFSYLWLVWVGKEATKCPDCGERGAGELVESEMIYLKVHTEWKDASMFSRGSSQRQRIAEKLSQRPAVVGDSESHGRCSPPDSCHGRIMLW